MLKDLWVCTYTFKIICV